MRILVTGAQGFAGRHLVEHLRARKHTPLPVDLPAAGVRRSGLHAADLCDAPALARLVRRLKPDACLHLGGIAFVPAAWDNPARIFAVNTIGTVNLIEAFRRHAPRARVVVVSSAEVYGSIRRREAVRENAPLHPANPYALSKLAAEQAAFQLAARHGLWVAVARPENHIGPGQFKDFVAPAFARQVAAIARGKAPPVLRVGNLASRRDFLDVRDVVRAYRLLLTRGRPGEAYNIASGRPVAVRDLLRELCRLADLRPRLVVDPARYRPVDHRPSLSAVRIRRDTGWRPNIPLTTTLRDILREALADVE